MTTPYGDHAERAASAMAALVRGDSIPTTSEALFHAIAARDVALSALRERLRSQFQVHVKPSDPAATKTGQIEMIQIAPLDELGYVLEQLPRRPLVDDHDSSRYLASSPDPIADTWTHAARELLLANHVLDNSGTKPWLSDPRAHAALAADTAQLVEAFAVLDERFAAAGALAEHSAASSTAEAAQTQTAITARLIAATVDRLASWAADHTTTDLAYISPPTPPEHAGPVLMVQVPADIAPGQRQLQSFLHPMATQNLYGRARLSADTANVIARNQAVLLEALEQRINASGATLAPDRQRMLVLRALFDQAVYTTRGLHDATGPREQGLLRDQQREISGAVRRGHVRSLTDRHVTDLVSATESTLSTWAAAVKREAGRKTTQFRVGRRGTIDNPIYGRIRKEGPAARALGDLASLAPPVPRPAHDISIQARIALRSSLASMGPVEVDESWAGPVQVRRERPQPRTRPAPPPRR